MNRGPGPHPDLDSPQVDDVRSRLAAIVDSSDDAIISKTLDGVILTWNRAAEQLFGYSQAEAVGQSITIIIPPDLHDDERDILRRVRAGERIAHFETRRVTRDRRTLDVSITVSPLRDRSGEIVGASKILRDITDSKRAQAALRESERRLATEVASARTLQSISARLISEVAQESLFSQILEAAMELMAADAASVQMLAADGQSLTLLGSRNFHPDSSAFWLRVTAEATSTCGVALRDNTRVLVPDVEASELVAGTQDLTEYRRCSIRAVQSTPLRSRAGGPLGMLSTHWRTPHTPTQDDFRLFDVLARQAADLIERTRAENALRESEERFRLIANTAPVIIWMSDVDKQPSYVNQAWLDVTGRPADAALGSAWMDVVHPDDVVRCLDTYAKAFDRREVIQMQYRLRRVDGEYRWIVGTGVPNYHADGSFAGYIGSGIDVSERKRAEEAVATIKQQLVDAQEGERRRIARELHDDIAQRLGLLGLTLDSLSCAPAADAKRSAAEARKEVLDLIRDVQLLSHRLHPARVESLGIAKASAALCREICEQRSIEVGFRTEGVPEGLPRQISVCLYRVLQEGLQNAIKHSGARRIDVFLRGGSAEIELKIQDSGGGFDVGMPGVFGLGLTSMRERLAALQGQLVITSGVREGTTVHARVPVIDAEPSATL